MQPKTSSSGVSDRVARFTDTAAGLLAALGLLATGYLLLIGYILGSAGLPARGALVIGASVLAALIAGLLLSLWADVRGTSRLITRIEHENDPDRLARLLDTPPATTAECRRLLARFANVITQLQRSTRELRLSEKRFALAMQAANDGIWDWQFDNRAVYCSPRWQHLLGYAEHELPDLFLDWESRVHPDDLPRTRAAIDQHLAGSTPYFELEHRLLHQHGSYRWVLSRGIAVRDERGQPYRMVGSHADITERVQAYELLEQRVAERTRELSTLLEISHDVASTLELKPLLALILDQLLTVVDYSGATIYLAQDEHLVLLGYRDPIPADTEIEERVEMSRLGMIWQQISGGACVIIDDTTGDTPLAQAYQTIVGPDLHTVLNYIRSWIGVPLMLKDRVIGMLSLKHATPHQFSQQHMRLALAVANQSAVAIENARLFEQAQGLAALMERQRLARELHDSVSQALYGIALGARTARTLLDRDPSRLAEPLDYVLALAEAGLTEMRALIFALRPESLELEGLAVALLKQAASVRARHGIAVEVQVCDEPELAIEHKEALYRIAQEALHNIVKHAQASRVALELSCNDRSLVLRVRDDGRGFDPNQRFPGHLGLHSMRERVTTLGGTLIVTSQPGQGTLIQATLPA